MALSLQISKQRKTWWLISGILVALSIAAMAISMSQFKFPIRPGLDFTGGTRLQLERDCSVADCSAPIDPADVREILSAQGLGNSSVQVTSTQRQQGQGVSIRTGGVDRLDVTSRTALEEKLSDAIGPFDSESTQNDTVGPVLGERILSSGLVALLVAFAGIVIYLSVRFKLDYAILALVALFHDVFISVGVFAALGLALGIEVNSLFIVALLTIVGFSVNDTVVIYDRIREMIKFNPEQPIDEVVDNAVNQTLGRSINTTLTTTLPLIAIFLFGGLTLKNFSLALIIGFILGAYSSIFIASSMLGWWRSRSEVLLPATTQDEPIEESDSSDIVV